MKGFLKALADTIEIAGLAFNIKANDESLSMVINAEFGPLRIFIDCPHEKALSMHVFDIAYFNYKREMRANVMEALNIINKDCSLFTLYIDESEGKISLTARRDFLSNKDYQRLSSEVIACIMYSKGGFPKERQIFCKVCNSENIDYNYYPNAWFDCYEKMQNEIASGNYETLESLAEEARLRKTKNEERNKPQKICPFCGNNTFSYDGYCNKCFKKDYWNQK